VLAAAIPLWYPMLVHYATEVRPYSMEMCAVVFLFFLPCWMVDEPRDWVLDLLGASAAILIASHYSAFLSGFVACLVVLLPLRPLRAALKRAARFAIPLGIAVIVSYILQAQYQFGFLITGGRQVAPVFRPLVLYGKDFGAQLAMIRENFTETGALPLTVYLLAAPFFAWFGPRSVARLRTVVWRTWVFSALSVFLLMLASFAGKLPWSWPTRWSIGYHALSASCLAMIIATVGTLLCQIPVGWPGRIRLALLTSCLLIASWMVIDYAVGTEHPYYETTATQLQSLAASGKAKSLRFFVQFNSMPTTRYLVELGPLKGAFSYPQNFHFETMREMTDKTPISANDYDVIVLTHNQFVDPYRTRISGGTADVNSTPAPSSLLMIRR